MNKPVVLDINADYIYELKLPSCTSRDRFRQASYSIWAAESFYKFVENKENLTMADLEHFVEIMNDLSCCNKKTSYIFSVAKDIAEDILDIIMAQI